MSNRPGWSADAFAQRVKMSEDDLWLIVEGRDHDRPHYEKLLEALPSTSGRKVSIRLAEQITLDGVAAGGKVHALALHDHLESNAKLTTKNKAGASAIVFMVDRDRDDFMGALRSSEHVFYTFGSDVEADILLHADIWAALRNAYGIDTELSGRVQRSVPDPAAGLLDLWDDWLTLGLTALECGQQRCAAWGTLSQINPNYFDTTDARKAADVKMNIQAAVERTTYDDADSKASAHFASYGVRLLKGRWLAHYMKHLVDTHLDGAIVRKRVNPAVIIDTALAALSHDAQWAREYETQFAKVLGAGTHTR